MKLKIKILPEKIRIFYAKVCCYPFVIVLCVFLLFNFIKSFGTEQTSYPGFNFFMIITMIIFAAAFLFIVFDFIFSLNTLLFRSVKLFSGYFTLCWYSKINRRYYYDEITEIRYITGNDVVSKGQPSLGGDDYTIKVSFKNKKPLYVSLTFPNMFLDIIHRETNDRLLQNSFEAYQKFSR